MRKLFKKSMAVILTTAMAITGAVSIAPGSIKTAEAADAGAVYNAYTVFQTNQIWAYRNQWTDGKQGGLDGGNGPGVDYTYNKMNYNYLKNWVISGGEGANGKVDAAVVDGDIKDAKMDKEGDYEISINNIPLADKVAADEQWSLLVISTDIPVTNTTVKCTNVEVYLDDETTPFAKLAEAPRNTQANTNKGASNFEIFSSYAVDHGTEGKVLDNTKAEYKRFPKKSMRIKFHISGVDFGKQEVVVSENGPAEGQTFTAGDYKYKVMTRSKTDGSKGTVAIAGLSAAAAKKTSLTTPSTAANADGCKYTVTNIAKSAFANNKVLKKIKLGSSIKTIGTGAFKKCTKLTDITYNKKVTSVGTSVFEGCTSLSKITLGSKVKSIKKSAFKGCKKLSKISVSQKVKVTKGAFTGCKKTITVSGKKANKTYTVDQIKKSGYKKVK